MNGVMKGYINKRNIFFIFVIAACVLIFVKRYSFLPDYIVSNPDTYIEFNVQDEVIEQTWQPRSKMISGVSMPYRVLDGFTGDLELIIYNDDRSKEIVSRKGIEKTFETGEEGNVDFEFSKTNVTPGERYHITVRVSGAAENGKLEIPAGSNHGGCLVGGEDKQAGAAFILTFIKYSKIFWLGAVLFPMMAISLFGMTLMKRKFEEVIAGTVIFEGIILYVFALAEKLVWGIAAIYIMAAILFGVTLILSNKKQVEPKEWLSPGLFIFATIFMLIVFADGNQLLGMRDDVRHWGPTVRDMFYYDSLAKHVNTTVILPRYLPFAALLEYLFVYMNGLFNEGIVMIAYHVMMLSMLIIVCKPLVMRGKRHKQIFKVISAIVIMVCVPVIFFPEAPSSIRVDPLQAVVMAYILICYYSEKLSGYNCVRILEGFCALVLIKDIGLIFGGILALIILMDTMISQIREKKLEIWKLLYPVFCVLMVMALWIGWQKYLTIPSHNNNSSTIEVSEATAYSASGISIGRIIDVLKGNGDSYQYQTTRRFLTELFDGNTFQIMGIQVSFADMLILICALLISLVYFKYWDMKNHRIYSMCASILLGGLCLSMFLQITYWFSFTKAEALQLASFDRYLAPYCCAILIFVLWLLYSEADSTSQRGERSSYLVALVMLIMAISMPVGGIVTKSMDMDGNTTRDMIYGYDQISEILRSVSKRGEKVQFICSESDGYSEYIFRNEVCPLISDHAMWKMVGSKEIYAREYERYKEETGEDYWADVVSEKELENHLKDFQYVVLFHADEAFKESYSKLFEKCGGIVDGSIYQVIQEDDGISLHLIGRTGIKEWR